MVALFSRQLHSCSAGITTLQYLSSVCTSQTLEERVREWVWRKDRWANYTIIHLSTIQKLAQTYARDVEDGHDGDERLGEGGVQLLHGGRQLCRKVARRLRLALANVVSALGGKERGKKVKATGEKEMGVKRCTFEF